jgi:hypothetical protein
MQLLFTSRPHEAVDIIKIKPEAQKGNSTLKQQTWPNRSQQS